MSAAQATDEVFNYFKTC